MSFTDATIIIPAMDETYSLKETVDIIMTENKGEDINQIIIVLSEKRSSNECKETAKDLSNRYPKVSVINQTKPFAGGALQSGFEISQGTHTIMMSADLETDPHLIPLMIEASITNPEKIITVSRWNESGGFQGYNKIKLYCNFIFQKIIATLFFSKLTDITYAYRLIPTDLLQKIEWKELKHPMFLETAIIPLRLGTKFIEIPGKWKARTEGISQNTFMANFNYFKTAFRVRFIQRKKLIKK